MSIASVIIVPGFGDDKFQLVGNQIQLIGANPAYPFETVKIRLTDDIGQTTDQIIQIPVELGAPVDADCWSDTFADTSLQPRWDTTALTAASIIYAGSKVTLSINVGQQWTVSQTAHNLAGEFNLEFNMDSINIDPSSQGLQIHLRVVIGGTLYQIALVQSTASLPTRGIYKYDGSDTLLQASPGDVYADTTFQIRRQANNDLEFIYNGAVLSTNAGVTGNVTSVQLAVINGNTGAAGTMAAVVDDFKFESPIGTLYCTTGVYKKVSDDSEIGTLSSTGTDFLWVKNPSGGLWEKAYRSTGVTVTPIGCIIDEAGAVAGDVKLDDFSYGALTSFPLDNGCDKLETTFFTFPTRSGSGPINHAFPAGANFRQMRYMLANGGVNSNADFVASVNVSTNGIGNGNQVGQVLVVLQLSWSNGFTSMVGVTHNGSGLASTVGYFYRHSTTPVLSGGTNVNNTRADYTGELRIERNGTDLVLTMDGVSGNFTIGAADTLDFIFVEVANTAGPGGRTDPWDVDITDITWTEQ